MNQENLFTYGFLSLVNIKHRSTADNLPQAIQDLQKGYCSLYTSIETSTIAEKNIVYFTQNN
ncbi:MAG: hypothetical protein V7K77_23175 [Nostoc sp.]|uniref:hypothetical protein n=1 Tax=Nostoc sp. TaxID=1180 RepID=UPI002FF6F664